MTREARSHSNGSLARDSSRHRKERQEDRLQDLVAIQGHRQRVDRAAGIPSPSRECPTGVRNRSDGDDGSIEVRPLRRTPADGTATLRGHPEGAQRFEGAHDVERPLHRHDEFGLSTGHPAAPTRKAPTRDRLSLERHAFALHIALLGRQETNDARSHPAQGHRECRLKPRRHRAVVVHRQHQRIGIARGIALPVREHRRPGRDRGQGDRFTEGVSRFRGITPNFTWADNRHSEESINRDRNNRGFICTSLIPSEELVVAGLAGTDRREC